MELINHLRMRAASLKTLRARAKADFLDGKDRIKVAITMLAARPDRLRLAAENTFTGPLLTLATDGTSFQLLDARQNRFLGGPVHACTIARLIRVELQPREVVEVLLGGVPLPERAQAPEVTWDGHDGGREVLTLRDEAGRTEVVRLAAKEHVWDVREAELRAPSGQPLWRISHQGFSALRLESGGDAALSGSSVRLPSETYIEDMRRKSDVRLRWKERELNPTLSDEVFHLDPPAGVPMEVATCTG